MAVKLQPTAMQNVLIRKLEPQELKGKGLIYGLPGSGKTYLLATAPQPALYLLTEGDVARVTLVKAARDLGIKDLLYIEVEGKDHFEAVMDELYRVAQAGQFPFASVCLDGITDLQRLFALDILKESPRYYKGRELRNLDVLEQGEWGWLANATTKAILELRELPCHVFVTALVSTPRGEVWQAPAVQPKSLALTFAAHFNLVGYLMSKKVEDQVVRLLVTEPMDDIQIAKNPQGALPPALLSPDLSDIVRRIQGGDANA